MTISAKKYAQSLLEVSSGKSPEEVTKQITKLLAIMAENGDAGEMRNLPAAFEKLWNEHNDISVVEVTTAFALDASAQAEIRQYVTQKLQATNLEMNTQVDPSILGGVLIRQADKVYDGSLRTRLYELKNRLLK